MYPLPLSPALHRLRSESMPRKELLARPADVPPVADHARCAGEALEHHRPVAFCDDAPVEQHHRPRVALAPDQPTEALLELERRVGNKAVGEAVQAARFSAPWLVNSTNMPPSDACASSTSARATARSWPASSSRGSGRSVGMPNRHCDGKSKGEAWISRAFTREGGRSRPSRSSR